MIGRWVIAALCMLSVWGGAVFATEVLEFNSPDEQQRYRVLIEELRCPKCQNQNLEDSNAGIAIDLRNQVYSMINEGKSNDEIVDYMVARYGEFVLYRPVHDQSTAVLWYGPFALLLIGALIFILVVVKNKRQANKDA
ncbi:Cytochrome c-type biogenesis protein CcmH precursor [Marinomonas aquimarina]|uniref:Cytochrome c-type biogenesis protein n=1 Tax=Marinomonas aquimarina TaxID=295068 RepID=A0A1A8T1Q4_9GAMM|nr:cytochrome c-type biogenesis protein [Marinomonas aquimarina]SBS24819.1 Cytochrome c-type biogenesis protein CcmH precursor [Marinomonas aquimarina]